MPCMPAWAGSKKNGGGEKRGRGGGDAYSFVACLSHLTVDHASHSRRRGGGGIVIHPRYVYACVVCAGDPRHVCVIVVGDVNS